MSVAKSLIQAATEALAIAKGEIEPAATYEKDKMMGDAPELKPCPFCGGAAELREEHDNSWVSCSECQVSVEGFEFSEDASSAWNTRPDIPATDEKVKALREALQHLVDLDDMNTTAAMEQEGIDKARAAIARAREANS